MTNFLQNSPDLPALFHTEPEKQKEIEAFFALPRARFYLYCFYLLMSVGLILGIDWLLIQQNEDNWILFTWISAILLGTVALSRSTAGRGCLRCFGPGRIPIIGRTNSFEPRTQIAVWAILTAVAAIMAL